MTHLGRGCTAPREICLALNLAAASLIRNASARRVDAAEGLDLLQQAYEYNLVQSAENVREQVNFICHCCACCCEGLMPVGRFGARLPIQTTNYIPHIDTRTCTGCGRCAAVCPTRSIALAEAGPVAPGRRRQAYLDEPVCLGCAICVRNCPAGAIHMTRRTRPVITPLDSVHRTVLMATERGLLQNLIFDNQALFSHRAMAAILGAVLRLAPVKRALAKRQLQSQYLDALSAWQWNFYLRGRIWSHRMHTVRPVEANRHSIAHQERIRA